MILRQALVQQEQARIERAILAWEGASVELRYAIEQEIERAAVRIAHLTGTFVRTTIETLTPERK